MPPSWRFSSLAALKLAVDDLRRLDLLTGVYDTTTRPLSLIATDVYCPAGKPFWL